MLEKQSRRISIIIYVIALLTPFIGAALYMMKYKVGIGQLSIACSDWNDELSYYKMIESMVKYGLPKGFWGFNESRAVVGNLGAWSIATLLPYVGIGKIFGWNYMTPIVVNLVIWLPILMLFVKALKPTLQQQVFVSLAWLCYSINIRYIFSVTPENIITVLFVLFAIAFIKYMENVQAKGWLLVADIVLVYLTLMRGYYVLFFALILVVMYNDKKHINITMLVQVVIAILAAISFVLIIHFCTSEYFTPVVDTQWLVHPKSFVKHNLIEFIESIKYIWQALTLQTMRGSWYIIYLVILAFIIRRCIRNKDVLDYMLLFVSIILVVSMWTLYNAKEGCRHLMAYCMVGIMLIAYYEVKLKISYVMIVILVYTTWLCQDYHFTTLIPENNDQMEAINDGYVQLSKAMQLGDNEWDNTIIHTRITNYHDLYAVPEGFALNSCLDDYVRENWDDLNSKYIAYSPEGDLNDFLAERCEVIATYGDTVVYKIR